LKRVPNRERNWAWSLRKEKEGEGRKRREIKGLVRNFHKIIRVAGGLPTKGRAPMLAAEREIAPKPP